MSDGSVVLREGNRLVFIDRVNDRALWDFLSRFAEAVSDRGYRDVVLDLSRCTRAYMTAVVPLVCAVETGRQIDIGIEVELPRDEELRRLFRNANWAHFLDPARYDPGGFEHEFHLPLRRYATAQEQSEVVDAVMDIVMRSMEVERSILAGLEWSLNEITDNVLNHARAQNGGLVQVTAFDDHRVLAFAVADSGRGVLRSLREGLPAISSDAEAIREAVKHGVTRNPAEGAGNGLAGTLRIATHSGGSFKVTSGNAQLAVFKPDDKAEYQETMRRRPYYQGTTVSTELDTRVPLDLSDALMFEGSLAWGEWDIVDAAYTDQTGDFLRINVATEGKTFGSRIAGRQLRTKCLNVLGADRNKRLVIDWAGVPLISSSFADEVIGMMFVELGPMTFNARVQNIGMEPVVKSLLDRAVLQRMQRAAG
jgi:anti-sigma regulatory factor (Ser/Thr protein kinase)